MESSKGSSLLHNSFKVGILLKGIDGVLEVFGGFLLVLLNPIKLHNLIFLLTQHELSKDPHDLVANFILEVSSKFSVGSQHFGIIYLLSHGAIKLFLVSMLWQKKPDAWAYT